MQSNTQMLTQLGQQGCAQARNMEAFALGRGRAREHLCGLFHWRQVFTARGLQAKAMNPGCPDGSLRRGEESSKTRSNIHGRPREYEERHIVHTVRHHGQIVAIKGIPAEVCSTCRDALFRPETTRRVEYLLESRASPSAPVPRYQYA